MLAALPILLVILSFPVQNFAAKGGRGSSWWGLLYATEPTNSILISPGNGVIKGHFNLSPSANTPLRRKQRQLIKSNPGSLAAIIRGLRMAITECKFQFHNRRWNCPTPEHVRGKSLFGKIVNKGCRETAFVYAITSGGVVHSVSRACSEGSIKTCSCDRMNRGSNGIDWEWGGCGDNVDFGYRFGRWFVDASEKGRDLRYISNLHNNEAGRLFVSTSMQKECKCHGLSGGCSLKTCWMRLPSFRDVGSQLKDRFDGASRIISFNNGNFRRRRRLQLLPDNPEHKMPVPKDLVYFDSSPDFCTVNPGLGLQGTKERPCNVTGLGMDGCDLMCCGRGYVAQTLDITERCNCTFQWCCQVHCNTCKIQRTVYKCL